MRWLGVVALSATLTSGVAGEAVTPDTVHCPKGTTQRLEGRDTYCTTSSGAKEGPFLSLFTDGQPRQVGEFTGGSRVGLWKTWFPDGQLAERGVYASDRTTGHWEAWDKGGKLIKCALYDDGQLVEDHLLRPPESPHGVLTDDDLLRATPASSRGPTKAPVVVTAQGPYQPEEAQQESQPAASLIPFNAGGSLRLIGVALLVGAGGVLFLMLPSVAAFAAAGPPLLGTLIFPELKAEATGLGVVVGVVVAVPLLLATALLGGAGGLALALNLQNESSPVVTEQRVVDEHTGEEVVQVEEKVRLEPAWATSSLALDVKVIMARRSVRRTFRRVRKQEVQKRGPLVPEEVIKGEHDEVFILSEAPIREDEPVAGILVKLAVADRPSRSAAADDDGRVRFALTRYDFSLPKMGVPWATVTVPATRSMEGVSVSVVPKVDQVADVLSSSDDEEQLTRFQSWFPRAPQGAALLARLEKIRAARLALEEERRQEAARFAAKEEQRRRTEAETAWRSMKDRSYRAVAELVRVHGLELLPPDAQAAWERLRTLNAAAEERAEVVARKRAAQQEWEEAGRPSDFADLSMFVEANGEENLCPEALRHWRKVSRGVTKTQNGGYLVRRDTTTWIISPAHPDTVKEFADRGLVLSARDGALKGAATTCRSVAAIAYAAKRAGVHFSEYKVAVAVSPARFIVVSGDAESFARICAQGDDLEAMARVARPMAREMPANALPITVPFAESAVSSKSPSMGTPPKAANTWARCSMCDGAKEAAAALGRPGGETVQVVLDDDLGPRARALFAKLRVMRNKDLTEAGVNRVRVLIGADKVTIQGLYQPNAQPYCTRGTDAFRNLFGDAAAVVEEGLCFEQALHLGGFGVHEVMLKGIPEVIDQDTDGTLKTWSPATSIQLVRPDGDFVSWTWPRPRARRDGSWVGWWQAGDVELACAVRGEVAGSTLDPVVMYRSGKEDASGHRTAFAVCQDFVERAKQ